MMKSYYERHVFFCCNQKEAGKKSCQQADAESLCQYTKKRLAELGQHGPGKIRVSKSGCLGRCESGPCILVYPEQRWYTYHDIEDIDRIIEEDFLSGKPVTNLEIPLV